MLEEHKTAMATLLNCLDSKEILPLAQVVTRSKLEDIKESESAQIKAIVDHSVSVEDLLNRPKITIATLMRYLTKENIYVKRSATKPECVDAVIQYWKKPQTAPAQSPVASAPPKQPCHTGKQHSTAQNNIPSSFSAGPPSCPRSPQQQISVDDHVPHSTAHSIFFEGQLVNIPIPPAPAPALLKQLQTAAEEFVDHFYKLLNAYSNSVPNGPQLFLPDCFMNIKEIKGDREHITGGEAVRIRLARFVQEDGVCFTPNKDANSLEGLEIAEGVTQIRTCGLVQLRENTQNVGVFAQQFRVMKDAGLENKWRVKSTNIALIKGVCHKPITLALSRLLGLE